MVPNHPLLQKYKQGTISRASQQQSHRCQAVWKRTWNVNECKLQSCPVYLPTWNISTQGLDQLYAASIPFLPSSLTDSTFPSIIIYLSLWIHQNRSMQAIPPSHFSRAIRACQSVTSQSGILKDTSHLWIQTARVTLTLDYSIVGNYVRGYDPANFRALAVLKSMDWRSDISCRALRDVLYYTNQATT